MREGSPVTSPVQKLQSTRPVHVAQPSPLSFLSFFLPRCCGPLILLLFPISFISSLWACYPSLAATVPPISSLFPFCFSFYLSGPGPVSPPHFIYSVTHPSCDSQPSSSLLSLVFLLLLLARQLERSKGIHGPLRQPFNFLHHNSLPHIHCFITIRLLPLDLSFSSSFASSSCPFFFFPIEIDPRTEQGPSVPSFPSITSSLFPIIIHHHHHHKSISYNMKGVMLKGRMAAF